MRMAGIKLIHTLGVMLVVLLELRPGSDVEGLIQNFKGGYGPGAAYDGGEYTTPSNGYSAQDGGDNNFIGFYTTASGGYTAPRGGYTTYIGGYTTPRGNYTTTGGGSYTTHIGGYTTPRGGYINPAPGYIYSQERYHKPVRDGSSSGKQYHTQKTTYHKSGRSFQKADHYQHSTNYTNQGPGESYGSPAHGLPKGRSFGRQGSDGGYGSAEGGSPMQKHNSTTSGSSHQSYQGSYHTAQDFYHQNDTNDPVWNYNVTGGGYDSASGYQDPGENSSALSEGYIKPLIDSYKLPEGTQSGSGNTSTATDYISPGGHRVPVQGYSPMGYGGHGGGYNSQSGGYNPNGGGYNPQAGGYNPNGGGYHPQDGGGYTSGGGSSPGGLSSSGGGFSPPGGGFSHPGGGFSPPGGGFSPPGGSFSPPGGGFSPPGGGYNPVGVVGSAPLGRSFSPARGGYAPHVGIFNPPIGRSFHPIGGDHGPPAGILAPLGGAFNPVGGGHVPHPGIPAPMGRSFTRPEGSYHIGRNYGPSGGSYSVSSSNYTPFNQRPGQHHVSYYQTGRSFVIPDNPKYKRHDWIARVHNSPGQHCIVPGSIVPLDFSSIKGTFYGQAILTDKLVKQDYRCNIRSVNLHPKYHNRLATASGFHQTVSANEVQAEIVEEVQPGVIKFTSQGDGSTYSIEHVVLASGDWIVSSICCFISDRFVAQIGSFTSRSRFVAPSVVSNAFLLAGKDVAFGRRFDISQKNCIYQ